MLRVHFDRRKKSYSRRSGFFPSNHTFLHFSSTVCSLKPRICETEFYDKPRDSKKGYTTTLKILKKGVQNSLFRVEKTETPFHMKNQSKLPEMKRSPGVGEGNAKLALLLSSSADRPAGKASKADSTLL